MVTDYQTNKLYLADCLPQMQPKFYTRFEKALLDNKIKLESLPNTKDIWAVDYMPIQVETNKFIRFIYKPDYLCKKPEYYKTITVTSEVCKNLNIPMTKSDIIIDGGNVVRSTSKVIMTEKIFSENPHYTRQELINEIESLLQAELIVIPVEPEDWIGHADGEVRFLDEQTVLINNVSKGRENYCKKLKSALNNSFSNVVEVPFFPKYKSDEDATGYYINYLEMESKIFLPTFNINEDDSSVKEFERIFKGFDVIPVGSNEIAEKGGVLNCITWNIVA